MGHVIIYVTCSLKNRIWVSKDQMKIGLCTYEALSDLHMIIGTTIVGMDI